MKFVITPEIFDTYSDYDVGMLVANEVDNQSTHDEIASLLREAETKLRNTPDIEPVNSYPTIHTWREAHKQFCSSPKKYPPSVAAIVKRVVKGGEVPNINTLVDLYNYIGMKYVLSVGGEDIDTFVGDMVLTYAEGDEEYKQIGSNTSEPPEKGEVVYKDEAGIICRRFNWREADRTKLTKDTKNAVLLIETFPPTTREELQAALGELQQLVEKYGQCKTKVGIVEKQTPEMELK